MKNKVSNNKSIMTECTSIKEIPVFPIHSITITEKYRRVLIL